MMVYVAVRWGQLVVNMPVLATILLGGVFSVKRLRGPWILLGLFGSIAVAMRAGRTNEMRKVTPSVCVSR